MFIPVPLLLLGWALSVFRSTGSRGFVSKAFFNSQMVNLIVVLKNKDYPLMILFKRTRGLLNNEHFLFGISAFGVFRLIFDRPLEVGSYFKPTSSLSFFSLLSAIFCSFFLKCVLFCFLSFPLCFPFFGIGYRSHYTGYTGLCLL
jgi:hypothetical protein